MRSNVRAIIVAAAVMPVGVLAVWVMPASAATSVSVGQPTLAAKVLVDVPVSIICDIGSSSNLNGSVTVTQASGKGLHQATENFSVGSVNCDGVNPISVTVQVTGGPFKNGQAVISASGMAFSSSTFQEESFSSGAVVVKL